MCAHKVTIHPYVMLHWLIYLVEILRVRILIGQEHITPPSGRGLVIPVFYPTVRTGSSNTRFYTPPSGRGLVIPFSSLFFLVVT